MKNYAFFYGTLKNKKTREAVLGKELSEDSLMLVNPCCEIRDYAMYDLGSFPGIKQKEGGHVLGMLFCYKRDSKEGRLIEQILDRYEGVPTLYSKINVQVYVSGQLFSSPAECYLYNGEVNPDTFITNW